MAKLVIPDQGPNQEIPPTPKSTPSSSDSSGFGLVNWLFDHINERRPIFLSLYQSYENEIKLTAKHRFINSIVLILAALGDLLLFTVYALAVVLIIVGITFIFVKGTGLLEYVSLMGG